MIEIVYVSDLHLEINGAGRTNCSWADGDVLVLAGDSFNATIAHPKRTDKDARAYRKGVDYLKDKVFPKYARIFYVMGNHDHYSGVYKTTAQLIRDQFTDVPQFTLLENETFLYNDILFIGCTLWTDFDGGSPISKIYALKGMPDYHCIGEKSYEEMTYVDWQYSGGKDVIKINPNFIEEVHKESRQYIIDTLAKNQETLTVVITHHPPSIRSLEKPEEFHRGISPCFACDGYDGELEKVIGTNPQIVAWIHGHTHHSCNYRIGETSVISHQCGYYCDPNYRFWRPDKKITIKDGRII